MTRIILPDIPTAPGRLPGLGHALPLARRPLQFFQSLPSTGDIVRVDLGRLPVYFLTTPELIHEILVTQAKKIVKGRLFDRFRVLIGNGLVTSEGEHHRRQRRLVQPAFSHTQIDSWVAAMTQRTNHVVNSWKAGDHIQLDTELHELAARMIFDIMFSSELPTATVDEIQTCYPVISREAVRRAVIPAAFDSWPLPINRSFNDASRRLQRILNQLITDYRARPQTGDGLLSILISARDETGHAMTDTEIRDELMATLTAGWEPTATMVAWALHHTAADPAVEYRLRDEVDRVLGDEPINGEHLTQLRYVRQVIAEANRLHAAPILMRRAAVPIDLAGHTIPAGIELGVSIYALHRDPRLFPDPDRFDPDRWSPDRVHEVPRHAYVPFADGGRRCAGEHFAQTEMTVTLASIVRRWQLRPAPGHEVRETFAAFAKPDALPMTVHSRVPTTSSIPIGAE